MPDDNSSMSRSPTSNDNLRIICRKHELWAPAMQCGWTESVTANCRRGRVLAVAKLFPGEFSPMSQKWGSSLNYGCNYILLLTIMSRGTVRQLWPVGFNVNFDLEAMGWGAFPKAPVDGDNKHKPQLPRRLITGEQSSSFFFSSPFFLNHAHWF